LKENGAEPVIADALDAVDSAEIAMSQVVGFIKGKSAIHLARVYGERKRN
jgi:hypothetical protein